MTLPDQMQRLIDKDAINDALLRYCRGVDRADRELMLSAYHPDAYDEHGVSEGDPETFVSWALNFHGETQTRHQHSISNVNIDLDGDTAHVESYYCFWGANREGPPTLAFGRYIDRFERRNHKWAIAHRVCVNEYSGTFNARDTPPAYVAKLNASGPNRRDRSDVSYDRPLRPQGRRESQTD